MGRVTVGDGRRSWGMGAVATGHAQWRRSQHHRAHRPPSLITAASAVTVTLVCCLADWIPSRAAQSTGIGRHKTQGAARTDPVCYQYHAVGTLAAALVGVAACTCVSIIRSWAGRCSTTALRRVRDLCIGESVSGVVSSQRLSGRWQLSQ